VSEATLEAGLRALGIACAVEAHERLAVILPGGDTTTLQDPRIRRAAIAILPAHGFTHLALELTGPDVGLGEEARSASDPEAIDGAPLHRD
jgi:hypothetical protein